MFSFFEGFKARNVRILFLFSMKHLLPVNDYITPDVNNSLKLGILGILNFLILVLRSMY